MDMYSALADPKRRTILEMLSQNGQLTATEIYEKFSASPPAISQHLKVLREAKLVDMEKNAQQRIYRLNPDTLSEIEAWIHNTSKVWSKRFDALDLVLNAEKRKLVKK